MKWRNPLLLYYVFLFLMAHHNFLITGQKILLCGIQDVLLVPDVNAVPGARLGSLVGLTPQAVEKELLLLLRNIPMRSKQSTGVYSPLFCYWLLTPQSSIYVRQIAQQYISKNCWLLKKTRMSMAADIAFTPHKVAQVLKPNQEMVRILQQCKQNGHKLVVCSNWNLESFRAIARANKSMLSLFEATYISGALKLLTFEKQFFITILKELNVSPADCIYIERHQENISAARSLGINTLTYTNPSTVSRALRGHGLL